MNNYEAMVSVNNKKNSSVSYIVCITYLQNVQICFIVSTPSGSVIVVENTVSILNWVLSLVDMVTNFPVKISELFCSSIYLQLVYIMTP
jgi:hypothetical protein